MNSHSTDTINKEINKCVILCANCHRKLHYYKCNIDELKNKIHDRLQ
jgi:predicted HNH restriction endonuclease|nr:MAG TPA: INTRON TRANSFERASE [Caudoviricetes sp.]DAX04501.1 MAG TPA: INTRON TRANSFERASE [Bacteriophage sp.]